MSLFQPHPSSLSSASITGAPERSAQSPDPMTRLERRAADMDRVIDVLGALYRLPRDRVLLESGLRDLWDAFDGFEAVRGKRILDLGCGSADCIENRYRAGSAEEGCYLPWLCRAAHELGADAVGIDCGLVVRERFTFHRRDLLDRGSLSFLEDASFDAVNLRLVVSSPELVHRRGVEREERMRLAERLEAECRRLLKPDGRIIRLDLDVDEC